MNILQFDKYILVPTLNTLGLYSPAAHVLMLGTGIIESNFESIKQDNGPAMGFYQIEEPTYNDILRYINRWENAKLKETCMSACFYVAWPPAIALMSDIKWSVVIARLKYHMISALFPDSMDFKGMAAYYKKYYNTADGKADLVRATNVFESVTKTINA
jgi:hypothetical protein